jgi:hypothetical protein
MRRVLVMAIVAVLLLPGVALAGSATDAALALGAFAVVNQIISGTGIFGGVPAAVAVPAPAYVAPPPPPPVVYHAAPVYHAHWHKPGHKHWHGHGRGHGRRR